MNNGYESEEMNENPPEKPDITQVHRYDRLVDIKVSSTDDINRLLS